MSWRRCVKTKGSLELHLPPPHPCQACNCHPVVLAGSILTVQLKILEDTFPLCRVKTLIWLCCTAKEYKRVKLLNTDSNKSEEWIFPTCGDPSPGPSLGPGFGWQREEDFSCSRSCRTPSLTAPAGQLISPSPWKAAPACNLQHRRFISAV